MFSSQDVFNSSEAHFASKILGKNLNFKHKKKQKFLFAISLILVMA